MTKEEVKQQTMDYVTYSLNHEEQLQLICALLSSISNSMYENGYIKESNSLLTCELTIKEILK